MASPNNRSACPPTRSSSRSHSAAFEELLTGLRRRESLCVLSGEIGSGKTALCRAVLQALGAKTFGALVADPFVSREDLLKTVLVDFGVIAARDLGGGRLSGFTRTELSHLLYDFLGTLAPLEAFTVVVIDAAQNLSLPLLEEIRILSDSDGRERQLQFVLVGGPELRQRLGSPEMSQLEQRISVRCKVEPLTRDGLGEYVAHRLQAADGSADRVSFSQEALDLVYHFTGGVPRLINRTCDRALHHGHVNRAASIDAPIVETAIAELGVDRAETTAEGPPATAPLPLGTLDQLLTVEPNDTSVTIVEAWLEGEGGKLAEAPIFPVLEAKPAAEPDLLPAEATLPETCFDDLGSTARWRWLQWFVSLWNSPGEVATRARR